MMVYYVLILLSGVGMFQKAHCATLISSTMDINGRDEACLGEIVSFQCDISSPGSHRWTVNDEPPVVLSSSSQPKSQGFFNFSVVNVFRDGVGGAAINFTSVATVMATKQVNGTLISCEDDLFLTDPDAAQSTITIIGARIPNTFRQLDFDAVDVSVKLESNTTCIGDFAIAPVGVSCSGSASMLQLPNVTSSSSPIRINSLDLCNFNYSFTAFFVNRELSSEGNTRSLTTNYSSFGQVQNLTFFTENTTLMWTSPPGAPANCINRYRVTVGGQIMETADVSLTLDVDRFSVCRQINASVASSVPCAGFLESSTSESISFIFPPQGNNLIQSINAFVRGRTVSLVILICNSDPGSDVLLEIDVNANDGTQSPAPLPILDCRVVSGSLVNCTVTFGVQSFGTAYSVTVQLTRDGTMFGNSMSVTVVTVAESYCETNPGICIGVPVCVVVAIGIAIAIIAVVVYVKKRPKKGGKKEDQGLHGQQLVSHPDDKFYADPSSIGHEQAPTGDEYAMVDMASKKKQAPAGDEYAVVEKSSKKAKPTDATTNLTLYQDPGSIEHKQAPTGDFYAMPQQKGKKGKNQVSSADPESADVAAMYSTVNTSKKNQLTYAQLDVRSGSSDKPVPQSTPYATVVT